jgi:hypothetical protein
MPGNLSLRYSHLSHASRRRHRSQPPHHNPSTPVHPLLWPPATLGTFLLDNTLTEILDEVPVLAISETKKNGPFALLGIGKVVL